MNSVGIYSRMFHLQGKLKISTRRVLHIHSTADLVEYSFQTTDWKYMALALQDRTFLGEGVLFFGQDSSTSVIP